MYATPKALEMAVKEAAKASPLDTNRAIAGFYFHRLLYRVFSDPETPYVLKGGLGMLARTADARATRDIDLVTGGIDIDEAVRDLRRLAEKDAGDFVVFEFRGAEPIKADDEYRDGRTVRFDAYLGSKMVQRVSVDLVADGIGAGEPDWLRPADRLEVNGLAVCDYPVYPLSRAVADKFCGIVERHGGRPSSRVKDLADIVKYALTEDFEADGLSGELKRESSARGIELGGEFKIPEEWGASHEAQYSKVARQASITGPAATMEGALALAKSFLDPALSDAEAGAVWDHSTLTWASPR